MFYQLIIVAKLSICAALGFTPEQLRLPTACTWAPEPIQRVTRPAVVADGSPSQGHGSTSPRLRQEIEPQDVAPLSVGDVAKEFFKLPQGVEPSSGYAGELLRVRVASAPQLTKGSSVELFTLLDGRRFGPFDAVVGYSAEIPVRSCTASLLLFDGRRLWHCGNLAEIAAEGTSPVLVKPLRASILEPRFVDKVAPAQFIAAKHGSWKFAVNLAMGAAPLFLPCGRIELSSYEPGISIFDASSDIGTSIWTEAGGGHGIVLSAVKNEKYTLVSHRLPLNTLNDCIRSCSVQVIGTRSQRYPCIDCRTNGMVFPLSSHPGDEPKLVVVADGMKIDFELHNQMSHRSPAGHVLDLRGKMRISSHKIVLEQDDLTDSETHELSSVWVMPSGARVVRDLAFEPGEPAGVRFAVPIDIEPALIELRGSRPEPLKVERPVKKSGVTYWNVQYDASDLTSDWRQRLKGNLAVVVSNEIAEGVQDGRVIVDVVPLNQDWLGHIRPVGPLSFHHRVESPPVTVNGDEIAFSLGAWPPGHYRFQIVDPLIGSQAFVCVVDAKSFEARRVSLDPFRSMSLEGEVLQSLPADGVVCGCRLEYPLAAMAMSSLKDGFEVATDGGHRCWQEVADITRSRSVWSSDGWITILDPSGHVRYLRVGLPRSVREIPETAVRGSVVPVSGVAAEDLSVNLCALLGIDSVGNVRPVTIEMYKSTLSDEGAFEFTGIAPGCYALIVSHRIRSPGGVEYRYSNVASIPIFAGGEPELDLGVLDPVDLAE